MEQLDEIVCHVFRKVEKREKRESSSAYSGSVKINKINTALKISKWTMAQWQKIRDMRKNRKTGELKTTFVRNTEVQEKSPFLIGSQ